MEIPGIGLVIKDTDFEWYYSEPLPVAVLDGQLCRIVVEGYDDDPNKEDYHTAIANFLAIDRSVLAASEEHVFQYYKRYSESCGSGDDDFVFIDSASQVWRHVRLGTKPYVTRRAYGDTGIYISLECGCDWEEEHGLQIVFKNGLKVNKVGPYDGHLTNSDAYADDSLENVIFR